MPNISVIVPTYNRLQRLKHVLVGLEQQSYPLDRFEVVIVSDGATDGTDQYLQTITTPLRLVAVTQPNCGVAAARNRGVEQASGDLLLFVDDDVVPAPHLIGEHLRSHALYDGNVVVLGPMLSPPNVRLQPWVHWEQSCLLEQYEAMRLDRWQPTARQFYTGNASLARRHVIDAGGFDLRFRRAEDVELAYRLADRGLRFVFNSNAIGYHYAERSFAAWAAASYAYGRNDVVFARDEGQHWLLQTVAREFYTRHPLVRWLVRVCLGRKLLAELTKMALRSMIGLGEQANLTWISELACSAIFNLSYYQGFAEELGGRRRFLSEISRALDSSEHQLGLQV
jgi:GT2 family glycosyltransferase